MKKGPRGCLVYIQGGCTAQFCGDYKQSLQNHYKDPEIEQPGFTGKYTPKKLTWNPKMEVLLQMIFLLKTR